MTSARAKELIELGSETVLSDGSLLIEFLRGYSIIFLDDQPCEICIKYHQRYFEKFRKKAVKILEKMEKNKFKLKTNIVIHDWTTGEKYSHANMTDEKAIARLKAFPNTANQWDELPENWKELIKDIDPLMKSTFKTLKAMAKEKKIAIPHNASKQDLVDLLNE